MASRKPISYPRFQAFDANGLPLASGTAEFFDAGTSTNRDVYSDAALTTAAPNPVTLNSRGEPESGGGSPIDIYLDNQPYKIVLKDSTGSTVWTIDNYIAIQDITEPEDPANATDQSTDVFEVVLNRDPTSGERFEVDFQSANTTTTPTLENTGGSLGALTIKTRDGSALWADALNGIHRLEYDGTDYLLLDPFDNIPVGTDLLDEDDMASDSATAVPTQQSVAAFVNTLTRGHIDGLELSNGTDADHDIDVAVGVCSMRDGSSNRKLFELTSSITKQIDANWAEGSASGGFPSGLTLSADTEYLFFLIGKSDGTVDAGFDTSATATNLLSDASTYTWFRRIGSVITDGSSNIIAFSQKGDEFLLDTPVSDVDSNNPGTSAVLSALTVAAGQTAIASVGLLDSGPNRLIVLLATSPDVSDTAPSSTIKTVRTTNVNDTGGNSAAYSEVRIRTDSSSQIRTRVSTSDANVIVRVTTFGWIDDRGRNS